MRIGIVVFDDAEELDWVGPFEVLSAWTKHVRRDGEVMTISLGPREVTCAHGLRTTADHTMGDAPPLDVVVYPGGWGTRAHLDDEAILDWVRGLAKDGTLMTSVCTGSLVYAKAGLLDGRPVTTHWGALDALAELGQGLEIRPDDRFVDSGEVITAAGVSAGIDMALHLVSRLGSVDEAKTVRRYIQYDPAPPI